MNYVISYIRELKLYALREVVVVYFMPGFAIIFTGLFLKIKLFVEMFQMLTVLEPLGMLLILFLVSTIVGKICYEIIYLIFMIAYILRSLICRFLCTHRKDLQEESTHLTLLSRAILCIKPTRRNVVPQSMLFTYLQENTLFDLWYRKVERAAHMSYAMLGASLIGLLFYTDTKFFFAILTLAIFFIALYYQNIFLRAQLEIETAIKDSYKNK